MFNFYEARWSEFKHEIFPLLYFFTVQAWYHYNFPFYVRLGMPLSIIVCTITYASGVFFYCTMFLFPELYAPQYNLVWLDDSPDPVLFKKIFRTLMVLIIGNIWFYVWYADYYGMSGINYILLYVHWIVNLIFMARIMNRYNKRIERI